MKMLVANAVKQDAWRDLEKVHHNSIHRETCVSRRQ